MTRKTCDELLALYKLSSAKNEESYLILKTAIENVLTLHDETFMKQYLKRHLAMTDPYYAEKDI